MTYEVYKLHYLLGTYKHFYNIERDTEPKVGVILHPTSRDTLIVRNVIDDKIFSEVYDSQYPGFSSFWPLESDNWTIRNNFE